MYYCTVKSDISEALTANPDDGGKASLKHLPIPTRLQDAKSQKRAIFYYFLLWEPQNSPNYRD
jgi:hypothetical protein